MRRFRVTILAVDKLSEHGLFRETWSLHHHIRYIPLPEYTSSHPIKKSIFTVAAELT